LSTAWRIQAWMPQYSISAPTLYILYINATLQTRGSIKPSLLMTRISVWQIERKVTFFGIRNTLWLRGVGAGRQKSLIQAMSLLSTKAGWDSSYVECTGHYLRR
jgi:hypothetical protein